MKHLKKILVVALVAVSIMAVALSASAYTLYTNAPQVAVRNQPRTDISNVHVRLNQGTMVVCDALITSQYDGGSWWRTTQYGGTQKYIMSQFLSF